MRHCRGRSPRPRSRRAPTAAPSLAAELWGTGIRVNTIEPRAAVLSEGADALVGDRLRPDMIEPMETMVEAVLALCDCPVERTGGIHVSLDLIAELKGR